jgi:hypothetical protein
MNNRLLLFVSKKNPTKTKTKKEKQGREILFAIYMGAQFILGHSLFDFLHAWAFPLITLEDPNWFF